MAYFPGEVGKISLRPGYSHMVLPVPADDKKVIDLRYEPIASPVWDNFSVSRGLSSAQKATADRGLMCEFMDGLIQFERDDEEASEIWHPIAVELSDQVPEFFTRWLEYVAERDAKMEDRPARALQWLQDQDKLSERLKHLVSSELEIWMKRVVSSPSGA